MDDKGVIEDENIKRELECLNNTSKQINDLENAINEKRGQYRTVLGSSSHHLNALARKLGDCINKARPYYEAKRIAKSAHNEAQDAALTFERAVSMHLAAREMVAVAERGMAKDSEDPAWAEMLNHATVKVNEAESERYQSETNHQKRAIAFKLAEDKVKRLHKNLKSNINKSQKYFELKKQTQEKLKNITDSVKKIEKDLKSAKQLYSLTLENLEKISDSIHASRKSNSLTSEENPMFLGQRQEGVGAETPFNELELVSEMKKELKDVASVISDLNESDSLDGVSQSDSTCSSTKATTASHDSSEENFWADSKDLFKVHRPENDEGIESVTALDRSKLPTILSNETMASEENLKSSALTSYDSNNSMGGNQLSNIWSKKGVILKSTESLEATSLPSATHIETAEESKPSTSRSKTSNGKQNNGDEIVLSIAGLGGISKLS